MKTQTTSKTPNLNPEIPSSDTGENLIPEQTTQPTIDDTTSVPADLDALRSENDQLRAELRLRAAREDILSALRTDNARSPELLFQATRGQLQFDSTGTLTNTAALLADLKQKFPEQFLTESPSPPPSINSGAGRTGHRQPLTKEILATMKPRSIANLDWNQVKQIMES